MAEGTETDTGLPSLEEIVSWAGHKLDDVGGGTVGKVEGAYVDAETGSAEWLLSRMGRFGHHSLVPARDAVAAAGHVWVPYERDQIRQAPKVDPKSPITGERELELLRHYGIGGEAGRAADLAQRSPQEVTARPA